MDSTQLDQQIGTSVLPEKKKRGISGSTIKIIAIVSMLIDHIGAGLLGRFLITSGYMSAMASNDLNVVMRWLMENGRLYYTYSAMRMIGRLGFPIFCFLLVEGFQRTRDVRKYAMRLGLFALISEIPFDLCFNGAVLEFGYQNVYFTLFWGLLTMAAFDWIEKKEWAAGRGRNIAAKVVFSAAALAVGAGAAHFMKTDYAAKGVICIMVLYVFRKKKPLQIAAGCVAFLWELTAPLAFIPVGFYNGERGLKMKYFFYAFYPVHLLLIWLVSMMLGLGWVAVM
ncbi:MAG: conjugal transfer protein TraX [Eubacterium sp.]|nr:conjugal transfer protein TraX [Eubacterium sp.]MCM1217122.1 conjugal transfer protein TraX [Lachnospiraceae bacterium]MCM1240356.1 conjugal transfer protein TraX [Lachnospiraceae bacterium]